MLYFYYFLCFACGILVKFTDAIVDRHFGIATKFPVHFLTAVAYGALIGFLISLRIEFATLAIAAIAGNLIAGKFDNAAHILALIAIALSVIALGFPGINAAVLVLLAVVALADEFAIRRIRFRILLDVAALAVSLATANWIYFIAVLLFDLGYNTISLIATSR